MTIQQVLLLLLLWMWLPHPCHTEMLFRRTPDLKPKTFGGRASGNDGKAIHRQKRGWMWNQFFLLEEYTGSDYQYVGKLHSDQDKGDGSLKYILSGDGAGTLFIIDEKTGDIHATRRIDREEKAFYTLRAQAINRRTLRPVEPESEFVIKIHDINDNEPTFPEEIYTASVPEMSVVGAISVNGESRTHRMTHRITSTHCETLCPGGGAKHSYLDIIWGLEQYEQPLPMGLPEDKSYTTEPSGEDQTFLQDHCFNRTTSSGLLPPP